MQAIFLNIFYFTKFPFTKQFQVRYRSQSSSTKHRGGGKIQRRWHPLFVFISSSKQGANRRDGQVQIDGFWHGLRTQDLQSSSF